MKTVRSVCLVVSLSAAASAQFNTNLESNVGCQEQCPGDRISSTHQSCGTEQLERAPFPATRLS